MEITAEKIPGGFRIDGLELKGGKCGCTSVLPCCYSWSKIKRKGNSFVFAGKATGPDTTDHYTWMYKVKKDDFIVEVSVEDARDKRIFSGYYPPGAQDWTSRGWELLSKEGDRVDGILWRCATCRWLYKEDLQGVRFEDLVPDWKCPICNAGKNAFEQI
jgi:rubredoxin